MHTLNENWITEGRIDFEYKKYLLLAYLQAASGQFSEHKIYPFLNDLVLHHRNLIALKENTTRVEKHFPKNISKIDFENFTLHYEKIIQDDAYMEEIQTIIAYAIPHISDHIEIAKEIYDEVEDNLSISAVGIVPIQNDFGYLLFKSPKAKQTDVYQYELTIFESMTEKYRGLRTTFIDQYPHSLQNYEEAIKYDLIKKNRHLPNPATYLIYCKKQFPFSETVFPVAKRSFVKFLAAQA